MHNYREIFLIAFLIAVIFTPLTRILAFKLGILDHPKAHGIHDRPVPHLGGLAIYLAFVIGTLWIMDLSHQLKGVLVGATLVFVTGVLDARFHLRASHKLAVQILACAVMMFKYGVILDIFPNIYLNAFFTALGVIGLTNAINFLDNMDGLATGIVLISSGTIFIVAFGTGQLWLGYLSMALVGATAGFLIFNLRKAYVFMGDSGSTFLGFTLASLMVMAEWSYFLPVTLAVPLLILGVPILDMILITVLRIKEGKVRTFGEWLDYTGKDHFSHRMMRLGLGERGAVFSLWTIQFIFCGTALAIFPHKILAGLLGILFYAAVTLGALFFFRRRREILLRVRQRDPRRRQPARL